MRELKEIKVKPKPFFYDGQFHRYVRQIMAAFSGFQVVTGIQRDGKPRFINTPVIFGGRDRLSAWIAAGQSQNNMLPLPVISIRPVAFKQADDLRRAPYHERVQPYQDRNLTPSSEANVEATQRDDTADQARDLTVSMWMPVPYYFDFELTIMASNMDQGMQLVEQIGVLYNPELDMKVSDSPLNWTFLTNLKFMGDVEFGRQAADLDGGTREAPHTFSMRFQTVMHLSPPVMVYASNLIEEIHVQIKEMTLEARNAPIDWDGLNELEHIVLRTDDPVPDTESE